MTRERTPGRWRLLFVPPRGGPENMARDSALMERARSSGETVFSVYSWTRPTLSFGRNQTARGVYDREEIARREMDVVRRPTGGRALLHHREVTYSVTAPLRDDEPLRQTYHRINLILIEALSALGVEAGESVNARSVRPTELLPCFASPAEGELVSGGAKLVGSAQYREAGALLQHGSILIDDDQTLIRSVLTNGSEAADTTPAPATLTGSLGRAPPIEEVAERLFECVRGLEDADASPIDESEVADATASQLELYESELWTWRR